MTITIRKELDTVTKIIKYLKYELKKDDQDFLL